MTQILMQRAMHAHLMRKLPYAVRPIAAQGMLHYISIGSFGVQKLVARFSRMH